MTWYIQVFICSSVHTSHIWFWPLNYQVVASVRGCDHHCVFGTPKWLSNILRLCECSHIFLLWSLIDLSACVSVCESERGGECSWIWVSSECDHLKHFSDPYIPSLCQTHSDAKGGGRPSVSRSRNVVPTVDENPHIGNYRLLKTIGKGNFAKVKLARHILTSKEVTRSPVYLPFFSGSS